MNLQTATIEELKNLKIEVTLKKTVNDKLKKRVKLLVQEVYNLDYVPSVYQLKQMFSGFKATENIHWFNLIDKCEILIQQKEEQVMKVKKETMIMEKVIEIITKETESDRQRNERHVKEIETIISAIRKANPTLDIHVVNIDYLMGVDAKIHINRVLRGHVGYSSLKQKYFAAFGTHAQPQYFNELDTAFRYFMGIKSNPQQVA